MSNTTASTLTRNPNLELHARPVLPESIDPLIGPRPASWWTGPVPEPGRCPGVGADRILRSLRTPNLATCSRQEVLDYFDNGWALTELLFSSLQGRVAFYSSPYHRLRHPLIFYYCHPATLFVNKLRLAGLVESIDTEYEILFETGVDEMSWDDMSHRELDWPAVDDVTAYRRRAYRAVRTVIESHPDLAFGHAPILQDHPLWALFMALEHERIHLETSSVLIRELQVDLVRRPPAWPPLHPSVSTIPPTLIPAEGRDFPANPFVDCPGGAVRVGKPRDWPSYGWDNEYGERTVDVGPFRTQRFMVSNGEYLEFIRAEGYLDRSNWTQEGWGWRQFRNAKWPTFWVSAGPSGLHDYRLRTLFEFVDMPWSWPVEVNYHEAVAYCAWRQRRDGTRYRLMSEAKHHTLRSAVDREADGFGATTPAANLNLVHGSAGPVDAFPAGPAGVHDVFGNVWQWCEDHFHPLTGFSVHPYYDDFSTPCFDARHQMILGGSFASTGAEASTWARFHFRPHFFQHAGFRLVQAHRGVSDVVRLDRPGGGGVYEQDTALQEYMTLHYGQATEQLAFPGGPRDALEFPRRCAERAVELARSLGIVPRRALDVGCSVGRATFELARAFDEVLGMDLSERFVCAATRMRDRGRLLYFLREEGEIGEEIEALVPQDIDRGRVQFRQGDACALPVDLADFDLVFAANLLCRLPSPRAFLERLAGPGGLVRPGGLVFITTPGTWSETFTPREAWLGGRRDERADLRTFDGLKAVLGDAFELVAREDIPLVIREHRRKYQYIVSDMSAWRRV